MRSRTAPPTRKTVIPGFACSRANVFESILLVNRQTILEKIYVVGHALRSAPPVIGNCG